MESELTGTAFDYMRMDVPCPQCGQRNKEPISKLVASNSVACRSCRVLIDLTAKDTRAGIAKFADEAKKIKGL